MVNEIKPYVLGLVQTMGPVSIGEIEAHCKEQHKSRRDFPTRLDFFYYECDIKTATNELIREGLIEIYADADFTEITFTGVN